MAKSLARKKSDKKKKGEHTKTRIGTKEYAKSRAPHHLPGPKERGVARMLVRRTVNELLRIETVGWRRLPDSDVEAFTATAVFRDGQRIERSVEHRYHKGQRERIMDHAMNPDPAKHAGVRHEVDGIRKYRWNAREDLLREMQREYAEGFPAEPGRQAVGHAGEALPSVAAGVESI